MALTQISTAGVKDDAVTSGKIPTNAVGSSELADNAVDTAAITDDAVTSAKIAQDAVTGTHIAAGVVGSTELMNNGVITAKIADGAVTAAKIASQTITADKIANNAVNTGEIVDGSITAAKIATNVITADKIASGAVNTGELADGGITTAKIANDQITNAKIADNAIQAENILDQQVTLAKLEHGTSSNDGKFLRANNGADPTFETVTGTTINNNADNRIITGSGTANTLEGEANVTYEGHTFTTGLTGVTPKFVLKRTGAVDSGDNIFSTLQTHDSSGNSMAEITVRRESANDEAYMDFETKATGGTVQGSVRIKGSNGTLYCAGNLGRSNSNQPAYFNDEVLGGTTVPSVLSLRTLTNGGETGLLIRGTGQGGGSSSPHSCIRVDATSCGNNADQYGIYLKGQQQLVNDTTGIYADVYGSYSTTYCFRGHLQKQVGAYTTGTTFHSKITQTSSGGASYHFRGYQDATQRIRIELDGDIDNSNNSYGSLSDVKLKENIVDAASQWDDLKALKVRNFNFKDDPDKVKMIGLVAQEAEEVSAGLVKTDNDIEIDESTGEGKVTGTTKYLKYSILYMKAIKALQEAQTRIETLESKVAALEGS